jgi:hypothetical protein
MTLEEFRKEYPLLRTSFMLAKDLFDYVSAEQGGIVTGPTIEELLSFVGRYLDERVVAIPPSLKQDIGIYHWRQKALDIIRTAIQDAPSDMVTVPIYGEPRLLATGRVPEFKWPGLVARGRKTHWSGVPCHGALEVAFADFLDAAPDVIAYVKNERLGFSVTYHESNRPRQYFPDFLVRVRDAGGERWWIAETKGEIHPNTILKSEAAKLWCERMTRSGAGEWGFLFVQQRGFEAALRSGASDFGGVTERLRHMRPRGLGLVQYPPTDEHWAQSLRAAERRGK